MPRENEKKSWEEYRRREMAGVLPVLDRLGFELEKEQPHLGGERYLMQAVTTPSGRKLILLGRRKIDGQKVAIKATSDPKGARELKHERACRKVLEKLKFAYRIFLSPEELLFAKKSGYTISVRTFLKQDCSFLERPLKEQFSLALKSLEAQEGTHAATYEHRRIIQNTFGSMGATDYLRSFAGFKKDILAALGERAGPASALNQAGDFLLAHRETIDQYSGFLTHTDFVPHNFRVVGDTVYFLDLSSLRFGNKYEGWARFLNFMALYNPELEKALVKYVRDNRTEEETLSLKLMRVYRLGEIIRYYTGTLEKSSGDLRNLNARRVDFWTKMLEAVLQDRALSPGELREYKSARDLLRSEEEKKRQVGLH